MGELVAVAAWVGRTRLIDNFVVGRTLGLGGGPEVVEVEDAERFAGGGGDDE